MATHAAADASIRPDASVLVRHNVAMGRDRDIALPRRST
jgi:hypothetical protein